MQKRQLDKFINARLDDMTLLPSFKLVIDALNTPECDWLKDDDNYLEFRRLGHAWHALTEAQRLIKKDTPQREDVYGALDLLALAADEWDLMADGGVFYLNVMGSYDDPAYIERLVKDIRELGDKLLRLVYTQMPTTQETSEE
jgi:hypothetical protein